MKQTFFQQLTSHFKHGLIAELAEPQRWMGSFLFALTILFLFAFALGDLEENVKVQVLTAEFFLCSFFVLQITHLRIFAAEEEDKAVDIIQSYPTDMSTYYIAKVLLAVLLSALIIFPFLGLMVLLHGFPALTGKFALIATLSIVSLSTLGVLLSWMTQKASGRELLFPLLYFPLAVPVLLSAVQASFCLWGLAPEAMFLKWLSLLSGLCVIYFTLGFLLFEEITGWE